MVRSRLFATSCTLPALNGVRLELAAPRLRFILSRKGGIGIPRTPSLVTSRQIQDGKLAAMCGNYADDADVSASNLPRVQYT
ncbi:hypothetical protein F4823DRAFT_99973 [Ustulina deusta]|nr:hypothetical protein F4823DRAFT_99973 [Ustulina deusta]